MSLYKRVFTSALVLGSFASMASAATTGTLNLKGTVLATYNIIVTPISGDPNLSLDILSGETNKSVADVTEQSNNPAGYKIQALSANGGLLKNGTVDSVAYTIKYGAGSSVSLTTTAQTLFTSAALTTPANNTQNVKVSFAGKPSALAGDFTDTVTFSISAP